MVNRLPFDPDERRQIADAVKAAESGTCGEIVVVVDRRAGRYGDTLAAISVALATAFSVLGASSVVLMPSPAPGWTASTDALPSPLWAAFVWVAGFVGAWFLFEGIHALLRPFVSASRRVREAQGAAWQAFGRHGVHRTQGQTGVLLYVAEFERFACVLGDRTIDAKLRDEDWIAIRDAVLNGYRRREPSQGLLRAIELTGSLLAAHFPIGPDDLPEIDDEPHLREGP